MKMLVLLTLVGFSALTVEGEVTETPNSPVVIETPGSPVMIESATLGFNEEATSVIKIVVRATEPVDHFTVRVHIYGALTDKRPQGVVSRVLGPVGSETQSFEVRLENWFIESQHIRISVANVVTESKGTNSGNDGCDYSFCVEERKACVQMCGGGCVSRFTCNRQSCTSDCYCKSSPTCGG